MRQLVQDLRSGDVRVVDLPDPVPGEGEVLVRTAWSLISPGTESAISETASKSLLGKARERPDQARKVVEKAVQDGVGAAYAAVRARLDDVLTPGYSSMGRVEGLGAGVEGLRVGDRVACFGANVACHAERVVVPAPLCLPLPEELEDRYGSFGAVGAIAAHGVRLAGVEAGSVVAVIGLGLIGQLAAQLVTAAGASTIGIDVTRDRVELATQLGAAAGLVPGEDDVPTAVTSISGGFGADAVVITAASSDNAPIELAARIARDRATICVVGDVALGVPRRPFYEKELDLRVSRSYGPGRYDPSYEEEGRDYPIGYVRWTERRLISYFFEQVARGRVRLGELVTHEFQIERGVDAYGALDDPDRLAILIRFDDRAEPLRRKRVPTAAKPPATTGNLRVGLIGPGMFARSTLLPLLAKLDLELRAVAGSTPARAHSAAEKWAAGYAAADADELLADEEIDVVVIATRHDSHAALAERALQAGKAVLLEKPLALTADELERLRPLLADGQRLVVDFNRDFAPAVQRARAHFGRRTEPLHLGYRVNAGYLDPGHWLRDPEVGGGRVVGEGCHFVELASAVVDRPLVSIQAAALGAGAITHAGDNFVITLRYEDGSIAQIAYVATGDAALGKEHIEVLGGGRAATIDDFRRVELFAGGRRRRSAGIARRDKGHLALLAAAFAFFRTGGAPPIPYERLIETTEATFLARAALASGDESPIALRRD